MFLSLRSRLRLVPFIVLQLARSTVHQFVHPPLCNCLHNMEKTDPPKNHQGDSDKKSEPPSPRYNRPCKFFAYHGVCKNGDKCKFTHTDGEPPPDNRSTQSLCRFFMQTGTCRNEDNCRFKHVHDDESDEVMETTQAWRPQILCEYQLLSGKCPRDKCSFAHCLQDLDTKSQTYRAFMYKSKLCTNYQKSSGCPLDSYCPYAHGCKDLRRITDIHSIS